MKKNFIVLIITLFTLATASLMSVQYVQMKRTLEVTDNLFNISVNNAMDEMIEQLNRLKVEDYLGQQDRYKLLKFKRVEELNDRMMDLMRENYHVFFDTSLVQVGISLIDSVKILPHVSCSPDDSAAINKYNTLLATRNRLFNGIDFYNQFVQDISDYVVDNIIVPSSFNYDLLDSLVTDKLVAAGVDIAPYFGIYDQTNDVFLYSNSKASEHLLLQSPFKYRFHPNGLMSPNEYFILLHFPSTSLLFNESSTLYFIIAFVLVLLIFFMFFMTLRTIIKQDRLDEMKTDFINNMTHEIKTPLATVSLACEMLQDPSVVNDPANSATFVGIISDENRRLKMLVETILQNAKMSNKNFSLNRREVDVHSIITSVVKSFNLKVSSKNGSLLCELNASPHTLFCDELHITNLIYNLIDNAIKYSPGAPQVKVTTCIENNNATQAPSLRQTDIDDAAGYFVITVSDKGYGIDKESLKHIFEKFYRVSTGDVHDVKGFGIGLNYVQQVVTLHGGSVSVDSTPGQGSTFTVKLPRLS